jgi:hypothetical protein
LMVMASSCGAVNATDDAAARRTWTAALAAGTLAGQSNSTTISVTEAGAAVSIERTIAVAGRVPTAPERVIAGPSTSITDTSGSVALYPSPGAMTSVRKAAEMPHPMSPVVTPRAPAEWLKAAAEAIMHGQRPTAVFSPLALTLHETMRLAAMPAAAIKLSSGRQPLVPNRRCGAAKRKREIDSAAADKLVATAGGATTPEARLVRFLRLIDHLGRAPWASCAFDANTAVLNRLTAAHIGLITGAAKPAPELYALIAGPDSGLERCENLVWITNRQQGKTTTMGKFIAALSMQVQNGGTLACVYSTKQDRAAELCKAAKEYMYWMQSPAGAHPDWPAIEFVRDNERLFEVRTGPPGSPTALVCARPKNADACRGDAPAAAFFDEIAFTSADFWYKFALPLLQIRGRRFTCTTTPPPPKSFFDSFCDNIRAANANDETFFELLNHSLACDTCIDAGEAAKCCHRLHLVPPWKSLLQFNSLGGLMPKNRAADYAAEVFGVMKHDYNAFLPGKLVDACLHGRGATTVPIDPPKPGEPLTVWVGIDLAGHSKSEMGLCAIVGSSGKIVVIGVASVRCDACQAVELQTIVRVFIENIRAHPWISTESIIVPVIECNLNEVIALSLCVVFERSPPYFMPFTRSRFAAFITPGVGVWTSEDTKLASIQCAYQCMLDGQLTAAEPMVTVGRESFDSRARPATPAINLELLREQLCQFTTDDRGKVSGKTSDGANDDLGMAFLLALYWRLAVMSSDHDIR